MKRRLSLRGFSLLLLLLFIIHSLSAYELQTIEMITSEEELFELYDNLELSEHLYQEYRYLFDHPLELSTASLDELLILPLMTHEAALAILHLRDQGRLTDPQQLVEVLGPEMYTAVRPLVKVTLAHLRAWQVQERFYLTDDFEDDEPAYLSNRLRAGWGNHVYFGLRDVTEERVRAFDSRAGQLYAHEPLYRDTCKSAYLGLERFGILKKLVLGSYTMRWGRGVTVNSARRRTGEGLFYYDGTSERNQGIAASFALGPNVSPALFYSSRWRSHSVSSYLDGKKASRTLPEVYLETIWGGHLELASSTGRRLGLTHYGEQVKPRLDLRLPGFIETSRLMGTGLDLEYSYNEVVFGGEHTWLDNGETAYYLDLALKDRLHSLYASVRHYPQDYLNPLGYGFASADGEPNASDESGWYLELKNKLAEAYTLQTSFDQWQHPSSLISDREISTSLQAKPLPRLSATLKYRAKDNDVLKNGSRYYYSSLKPQITLHKHLKLILYYQLREDYNTREELDLDDNYYAQLKLALPRNTKLTNRLKYNRSNRLSETPTLSREFYTQLETQLPANLSLLLKATSTTKLLPLKDDKLKYKIQIDYTL